MPGLEEFQSLRLRTTSESERETARGEKSNVYKNNFIINLYRWRLLWLGAAVWSGAGWPGRGDGGHGAPVPDLRLPHPGQHHLDHGLRQVRQAEDQAPQLCLAPAQEPQEQRQVRGLMVTRGDM